MQKIIMPTEETKNFLEVFEMFVISQSAKGVADVTIRNYRYHMKNIGNYMDVRRPFDDVTKRDIESMAAAMRRSEMAHNSIATYMRMLRTFYNWCNAEGFSTLAVPAFKEKETVKDTYTDAELSLLLTDDYHGYLPTKHSVYGGGYSACIYNGSCPPEAGDTLVEQSVKMAKKLF